MSTRAHITATQADLESITAAVISFKHEYGKLPHVGNDYPSSDAQMNFSDIRHVLRGDNERNINFLNKDLESRFFRGAESSYENGSYQIAFDYDDNGTVETSSVNKSSSSYVWVKHPENAADLASSAGLGTNGTGSLTASSSNAGSISSDSQNSSSSNSVSQNSSSNAQTSTSSSNASEPSSNSSASNGSDVVAANTNASNSTSNSSNASSSNSSSSVSSSPQDSVASNTDDSVDFTVDDNGETLTLNESATLTFEVLGAAISYGGRYDMPVTVGVNINDNLSDPFGDSSSPLNGNINGTEPETYTTDLLDEGAVVSLMATSWKKTSHRKSGAKDSHWTEYMSKSSEDSGNITILKNGDATPTTEGFLGQDGVADIVGDYVEDGKMVLDENQAIVLFELGTSNISSSAADFQDAVVLITVSN